MFISLFIFLQMLICLDGYVCSLFKICEVLSLFTYMLGLEFFDFNVDFCCLRLQDLPFMNQLLMDVWLLCILYVFQQNEYSKFENL